MKKTLSLHILAICISFSPVQARDLYTWVQYVPGGIEARAVTNDHSCPAAMLDGQPTSMSERSTPSSRFPVRVCALHIPRDAKSMTINGKLLPLPKAHPDKILLIGDTGCRIKGTQEVQACNDMSRWPFRFGATIGADFKPDLVIHVGDMYYRESACPIGYDGCAGSPFGDSWDVWKEDFFDPSSTLRNAAPWVIVRGNHEECERGGIGWARILDPYLYDTKAGTDGCLSAKAPYTVDIGHVTLMVIDASTADEKLNPEQVAHFRAQFEMAKAIEGSVWYLLHRPLWAADSVRDGIPAGVNNTLSTAALGAIPKNVQAIIAGHIHIFQAMKFQNDLPVQVITGHGGTKLDLQAPDPLVGIEVGGQKVVAGVTRPGVFGFAMIERAANQRSGTDWVLTGYDVRGRSIARCTLKGRDLDC